LRPTPLAIGLAAVREGLEVAAALSPDDLLDVPQIAVQPWHDTTNELFVKFTNRDRRFQDDAVGYHLPGPDKPVEPDEYGASAPAWSGIVEVPYGLTRREDLVFAFLPVRAGQLCTDYLVYRKQRDGNLREMSRGNRFAQRRRPSPPTRPTPG